MSARVKRARSLDSARLLRPADVFEKYGIHPNTLGDWCRESDQAKRLPSFLIKRRQGRKSVRLIDAKELESFLARYRVEGANLHPTP